eukprot:8327148-Alexandrium_andersonii.AAC.1
MSASLVGSEMCIRDSFTGVSRVLTGVHGFSRVFTGISREFHGSTGVSVSYTHLTLPTICSV